MNFNVTLNEYQMYMIKKYAIYFAMALVIAFAFVEPAHAAGGLSKMSSKGESLFNELLPLIKWIAIIGILISGALYAFDFLSKQWFFRMVIGLIVAGAASEIVNTLM